MSHLTPKLPVSVIVLTKNDEKQIERCIKSLKCFDDIIIVDDNSTDRTVELAGYYPVSVIHQKLHGDFAIHRNRAMQQARYDWILFIDSDEEVTNSLSEELKSILNSPKYSVYYIKRRDVWWGKELSHGELATAAQKGFIRLMKKGSGHWKGKVHEKFVTAESVGQLESHILHYPHESITTFLHKINTYSSIRSRELMEEGKDVSVFEIVAWPFFKFTYTYLFKMGFKDGAPGFVYSFMMSFHSFLTRGKLYLH
jgi:glycosyltransferase involved in cell wall biosynthesis